MKSLYVYLLINSVCVARLQCIYEKLNNNVVGSILVHLTLDPWLSVLYLVFTLWKVFGIYLMESVHTEISWQKLNGKLLIEIMNDNFYLNSSHPSPFHLVPF